MKAFRQEKCCRGGESYRPRQRLVQGGFSLIELLLVVGIILVISTMYYGCGTQEEARQRQRSCAANLQKIYISLQVYATDHAGNYPVKTGATTSEEPMSFLVPKYDADLATYICPASGDKELPPGGSLLQNKISYAYYMGWHSSDTQVPLMSDAQVDTTRKSPGQPLFSSTGHAPGNNHQKSGGNVLFGDGRTESSPPISSFSLVYPDGVVLLNPKP